MNDNVKTIGATTGTPHAILTGLCADVDDIEAIFVVVKLKNGAYRDTFCGEADEAAYAVQVLTKAIQDSL